ncbi:expressed unknown protein [Seminavis robusta]|uniref:Uncharacterized protein n=1 Tax=Seminavis robusta TaxID=568900 RepID=A0A9N8E4K1_9STRA|nr:expressed unknown protein [Seminavis robusta]|eukprot:Sro537_g162290.1 n/a (319) ;mRNA; r:11850-12806
MAPRRSMQFPPVEIIIDEDLQGSLSTFGFNSLFDESQALLECSRWELDLSAQSEESAADCVMKKPKRQQTSESKANPQPSDVALKIPRRQQTNDGQAIKSAALQRLGPTTSIRRSRSEGKPVRCNNTRVPRYMRTSDPGPVSVKSLQHLLATMSKELEEEEDIKDQDRQDMEGSHASTWHVRNTHKQKTPQTEQTPTVSSLPQGNDSLLTDDECSFCDIEHEFGRADADSIGVVREDSAPPAAEESQNETGKETATSSSFLSRRMSCLILKALETNPELLQDDGRKLKGSTENLRPKNPRDNRPRLPNRSLTRDDLRG